MSCACFSHHYGRQRQKGRLVRYATIFDPNFRELLAQNASQNFHFAQLFALRGLPAILQSRHQGEAQVSLGLDLPGLLKSGFVLPKMVLPMLEE
jgi:hypothetical protein